MDRLFVPGTLLLVLQICLKCVGACVTCASKLPRGSLPEQVAHIHNYVGTLLSRLATPCVGCSAR